MINTIIIQKNLLLLFLLGVSLNSFGDINRYIRYTQNNLSSYGVIIDNKVHQLTKAPYLGGVKTGKTANLDKITLLAPAEPSKVIAVGYNYHSHRGDMELPAHPPIFLKLPTSIIATNESIIYPNGATDVHYEAELVVVMGKTASKVS